jgi:hypothetical protein
MDSVVNSLMLVCAVIAALAAGVLLGYMTCKGLFTLCSIHARALGAARSAAKAETQTVGA